MKISKKILSVLLAVLLACSFAACGNTATSVKQSKDGSKYFESASGQKFEVEEGADTTMRYVNNNPLGQQMSKDDYKKYFGDVKIAGETFDLTSHLTMKDIADKTGGYYTEGSFGDKISMDEAYDAEEYEYFSEITLNIPETNDEYSSGFIRISPSDDRNDEDKTFGEQVVDNISEYDAENPACEFAGGIKIGSKVSIDELKKFGTPYAIYNGYAMDKDDLEQTYFSLLDITYIKEYYSSLDEAFSISSEDIVSHVIVYQSELGEYTIQVDSSNVVRDVEISLAILNKTTTDTTTTTKAN